MTIFWFRRDLRVTDNTGLHEALTSGDDVLPIFIFDKNILDDLPKDDVRVTFIHNLITDINTELKKHKKSLAVFYGKPEQVLKDIINDNEVKAVYTNHDYEPYARKRDEEIQKFLEKNGVEFKTFKDQVIFEKSEVSKNDGSPYVMYTPYKNRWHEEFKKGNVKTFPSEKHLDKVGTHTYPFMSLEDIGFTKSDIEIPDYDISKKLVDNYADTRNLPAVKGTSRIDHHLRFGSVSIREAVKKVAGNTHETYLNELIWREFFMQILWHFPHTVNKSFKPDYDKIKWRNNENEFKAWCEGKTGYPMVDAGMRQLNSTGYMHNRVRLVTASFLCKHLLIDWRWGEAYFAEKLLDFEQANNVGNWQWSAGSGVDASPYFRVFNPTEQAKKFDKNNEYIKKWVPEFEDENYKPIVNHEEARERAITTYKKALAK